MGFFKSCKRVGNEFWKKFITDAACVGYTDFLFPLVEMSPGCRYFSDWRYAGIVEFTAELQPPHRHEHNPHITLAEGCISIDVGVIPLFRRGAGVACSEAEN